MYSTAIFILWLKNGSRRTNCNVYSPKTRAEEKGRATDMTGKCDVYQRWPDWPCTLRKAMSAPAWAQKLFDPEDSESWDGSRYHCSKAGMDTNSMEPSGDRRWLISTDFGVKIQKAADAWLEVDFEELKGGWKCLCDRDAGEFLQPVWGVQSMFISFIYLFLIQGQTC